MPSKRKHNKAGQYRDVILDSNIVQYLGTPGLEAKIVECLREAVTANYDLAISDISFYELLNAAPPSVESEIVNRLAGAKRFFVDKKTLVVASHLGCLYAAEKINEDKISVGDKIIGAAAVLFNALIYTANVRDFPQPFFRDVARKPLFYKKNNGTDAFMYTAFIEPDLDVINQYNNIRLGKLEAIKN